MATFCAVRCPLWGFLTFDRRTVLNLHILKCNKAIGVAVKVYELPPETKLTSKILNGMTLENFRARKLAGINTKRNVPLPLRLMRAVTSVSGRYPISNLENLVADLRKCLHHRKPPAEPSEIQNKVKSIEQKVMDRVDQSDTSLTEEQLQRKVEKRLKVELLLWKPIEYNATKSLVYMASELGRNYATLHDILAEIKLRDPDFQPKTMLDFGSGLATSVWAVNNLWKTTREHFCIDSSVDISTLARLLLQGGKEEGKMAYPGIHFRRKLPAYYEHTFDMVFGVSVLMDLPSKRDRLHYLEKLWAKTDRYLILSETGGNAGFKLIQEARTHILNMEKKDSSEVGHVFSPCPHDVCCPRLVDGSKTPCNFRSVGPKFSIGPPVSEKNATAQEYLTSYVVLKKGKRPDDEESVWPRLVRYSSKRRGHVHCRTCVPSGELKQFVVTGFKNDRMVYKTARIVDWGDRLPVVLPKEGSGEMEVYSKGELEAESSLTPPDSSIESENTRLSLADHSAS